MEFFAGEGNVFAAVRADGINAVKVDITYLEGKGHAMDILSESGLVSSAWH